MDLKIINYSEKVTYENLWDENLLQYRALVYNSKYEVVAKSFNRFFNIEEEKHEATDDFEVFEKLDGSLILAFWYAGQMIVASRGSFTSPYALEAKRLLDEKYPRFKMYAGGYDRTYCMELIGFEQIVVSYPVCDLIITGIFESDGIEVNIDYQTNFGGVPIVTKYLGLDWKNIKHLNWNNSEGFVVKFSNGQRCKIKFEDYIKLHRQMTNLSTRSIWKALADGEPVSSILNDVPDEFYDKVHEYEEELNLLYREQLFLHKARFHAINLKMKHDGKESRKDFVETATEFNKHTEKLNLSIIFCMLDGKDYSKHIWKIVEPKFEKL